MIFSKRRNNKNKGYSLNRSMVDILFFIVVIFVLIIGFTTMKYAWTAISGQIETSSLYEGEAKTNIDSVSNNFFPLLDSFLFLIIIGIMLATIIGAYMLRTTPVFYVVAILFTIIELIIAVPLANAYNDDIRSSGLSATTDTFTLSNFVFQYLPYWVFIFNCIVSIIMYGLGRAEYG